MTEVFIRRASGLTRAIGPWDALAYAFMTPCIMNPFFFIIWTNQAYPGVNMILTTIPGVLLMFIPALLYIWFSIAMPRSGGEYIWGSRTISPAWGFCAGLALTIVGASWAGSSTFVAQSWGFNMALRDIAIWQSGSLVAAKTHSLWLLADTLDTVGWLTVLCSLWLLVEFLIMWKGARAAMYFSWFSVITATISLLSFVVGVLASGGLPVFIEKFNAMSGTTYQAVLDAAEAGGWPVRAYDINMSLGAGSTFVALNTLGSTYTANIMGEVKEVKKSSILAMLGALVLFLIYWVIFYSIAYWGFGGHFWAAIAYFVNTFGAVGAGAGTWEGWPFGNVFTAPNFMLVFLNPAAAAVTSLMAAFSWISCAMGEAFGPVRNIFAYSFDRVLPTFFAKTDRKGSPWTAVLLGWIIAWVFLFVYFYQGTWVAYTTLAWFFAWVIVGAIGMTFPYTSRGKSIFEKSPEIVKKKIGGVPLIFIFGLLTFLVSGWYCYNTIVPFLLGLASAFYLWVTVIMFVLPSFVIYYISRAYYKSKGIPMELQFKEIPPD